MALVNPQIAMSYRPTVEYQPRNALAEYAQIQSIVGGQRQAEMADMQMARMKQEDAEIERIHRIAMQHGGPENRLEMGKALFASRNPQQRELGYKIIQHEEAKKMFAAAESRFGYAPTGAAAAAAGAATAPAPQGEPVAAPILPSTVTARDIPPVGGAGALQAQPLYSMNDQSLANLPGDVQNSIRIKLEDAARLRADTTDPQSARAASRRSQAEMLENQAARLLMANKLGMEITGGPDKDAIAQQKFNAPFYLALPENQRAAVDREFNLARDKALLAQATQSLGFQVTPANALAPAAAAPVANALAPAAAAPVANAMVAPAAAPTAALTGLGGKTLAQLQNEYRTYSQLEQLGAPGAKGRLEEIKRELDFIYKTSEPGADQKLMRDLKIPITEDGFARLQRLKENPGELTRLLDRLNLPLADRRRIELQAVQKLTTHAPATTVNVSTEKKYGEAFGTRIAEVDINKMTTAEKAPQLAESANRIIGLVQQGNLFTGPAADIKLNIARALNVAGASNQEKISNTESLIAATGQSTLDAIKGAGLGTGQGFTDKDLKFLRDIAGGTINLTQQTLTELARLQHRVAERSAESWNKRLREIPPEVVQGTGLSTTPIVVPKLLSAPRRGAATADVPPAPAGVDAAIWNAMTPQERSLWQK